jgi:hypothetical protein
MTLACRSTSLRALLALSAAPEPAVVAVVDVVVIVLVRNSTSS